MDLDIVSVHKNAKNLANISLWSPTQLIKPNFHMSTKVHCIVLMLLSLAHFMFDFYIVVSPCCVFHQSKVASESTQPSCVLTKNDLWLADCLLLLLNSFRQK